MRVKRRAFSVGPGYRSVLEWHHVTHQLVSAGERGNASGRLLRMSRDIKDIAAEALELPLTARAELASQLLESLDDLSEEENEQLWAQEAERRYAEYKA